jgi:hypothetical protein
MATITHKLPEDIHDDSPWPEAPETTPTARATFRAVLAALAAKARTTLPESNGRVEKAVALVLAGDIAYDPQTSTALVGSCSDATKVYRVRGKVCECPDYDRAPQHLCKHVLGVMFLIRLQHELGTAPQAEPPTTEAVPQEPVQGIDPKWLQMIHGKPFVVYAGLLHLARDAGLVRLEAQFISVTPDMALAAATATFADGRMFREAADATPSNVNAKVRQHYPRMALTRAKARCLRDALGIDLVAVEELE